MGLISLNISYLLTLTYFPEKIMIKMAIKSLSDDSVQQTIHISNSTDICTIDSLFKNWPCKFNLKVLRPCSVAE